MSCESGDRLRWKQISRQMRQNMLPHDELTRSLRGPLPFMFLRAPSGRLEQRSLCLYQWQGSHVLFVDNLMFVPQRLQVTS